MDISAHKLSQQTERPATPKSQKSPKKYYHSDIFISWSSKCMSSGPICQHPAHPQPFERKQINITILPWSHWVFTLLLASRCPECHWNQVIQPFALKNGGQELVPDISHTSAQTHIIPVLSPCACRHRALVHHLALPVELWWQGRQDLSGARKR